MCFYHLNVGPGHTPASELGVLLGWPWSKIHLRLHLALAWVYGDLQGVNKVCVLFNKIRERSYFVRVQHNVGIPMFIFPLLDYFLVDEVPLKQFNQRLGLVSRKEASITCGTGQPYFRMYSHSFEIGWFLLGWSPLEKQRETKGKSNLNEFKIENEIWFITILTLFTCQILSLQPPDMLLIFGEHNLTSGCCHISWRLCPLTLGAAVEAGIPGETLDPAWSVLKQVIV